jgi:RND family efflux transporter MFP subunit
VVDVGSVVSKGQVLVQLDNSLLKLQLQAIEVQIEGLQNDVNRFSVLAAADAIQGVQLEKAEIGLKSALVQKATLLEQINKTTIKSPFNGIVTAKLSEEGAFAAPGMPLLQITDISQLRFTVNVPESDLVKFHKGVSGNISVDVFPDIQLSGEPVMIGSKANMGNSFSVQFKVRNTKESDIKAGMFGKVYITDTVQNEGVLVPSSAIVEDEENMQIYLIKNGKAVLQEITVSGYTGNMSVVSDGLQAGDVIVTSGLINLFNGANVVVR